MRNSLHWPVALAAALVACRALDPRQTPISTDRPGLLFASSVVPRGAVQWEFGAPFVQLERDAGARAQLTSLPVQARYGWVDGVELRAGGAPAAWRRDDTAGATREESGAGDLELGLKWAVSSAPATVLLGAVRLPSGAESFTAGEPAYSVFAVSELALAPSTTLKGMLGWTGEGRDASRWRQTASLGVLVNQALAPRWSVYGEAASFPSLDGGASPTYAGLGLVLLLASSVQLDIALDLGLDDAAQDALFGVGLSLRW